MTKRLLVIDDEDGVREIIQISLQTAAGWEVLSASSGSAGLAIAQTELVDAILLDVMMPEQDGISIFQQLQIAPKTQSIPVIFLTAKARLSEQRQFVEVGAAGVIVKPFQARDLVRQIEAILGWRSH
ncbi:MAG: response regulator [Leptolyngbya sp. SIO4C1]|nr:response regulator [Leptolyngbya sp. SIO4C1]